MEDAEDESSSCSSARGEGGGREESFVLANVLARSDIWGRRAASSQPLWGGLVKGGGLGGGVGGGGRGGCVVGGGGGWVGGGGGGGGFRGGGVVARSGRWDVVGRVGWESVREELEMHVHVQWGSTDRQGSSRRISK